MLLESQYLGVREPHLLQCQEGHVFAASPLSVGRGQGECRLCVDRMWDVFYVVRDPLNDVIKFGITCRDGRIRLQVHARDGFDEVLRLHVGLPADTAPALERQVIAALNDAGEQPVRGREYFPARVLPLVLDLVDNHPAVSS